MKDQSNEHPAEVARRKREESKQQAIYEKIARLKRSFQKPEEKENPATELLFAINLKKSHFTLKAGLELIEVDSAGSYLRNWNPSSIYELKPAENTLIKLLNANQTLLEQETITLEENQCKVLLATISSLGKLYYLDQNQKLQKLSWVKQEPELVYILPTNSSTVEFFICSNDKKIKYQKALLAIPGLYISINGNASYLKSGNREIIKACLQNKNPDNNLLRQLVEESGLRPLEINNVITAIKPQLIIRTARYKFKGLEQLHADLFFNYNEIVIHETDNRQQLYEKENGLTQSRDLDAEQRFRERLDELNFRYSSGAREEKGWKLLPSRLDPAVKSLVGNGWTVHAEGKCYHAPAEYEINIKTGHDWFELKTEINFGDESIPLPQILKMYKEGKQYIELGDGSFGLLPVEWLTNYTVLMELGRDKNGQLICSKSQAAMLQALLDNKAKINSDQGYKDKLGELNEASVIKSTKAPSGFIGELRSYQQEALGWMLTLQKIGFGGILALDMGLGKTPTVLALLQGRKTSGKPSLVIVPRSLIFNWEDEAKKFTPDLSILIWRGGNRKQHFDRINDNNIVLTTYGTLCRDAEILQSIRFDYCILDESQAIKNSDTANAKAVRSVNCDHRIAMTGTPIENSLSELWSQFEFLNPGFLGTSGALKRINSKINTPPINELKSIAQALQPFLFRRTKKAVAKDLPNKSEIILYCEMQEDQQAVYEDLFTYYRQEMEIQREDEAVNQQSSFMLAALLRLRQAACHPALINKSHSNVSSAKISMLFGHLEQIICEGHKVLVFSQFTSMLSIIRIQLKARNINYSYLDGQTSDRATVVNEFQNIPDKKVFLISLKAGGVGLNLTAASYVFIMDPWWNPAIEAQAVDRAYRIGQKNNVIAYKMVTKNTVEEKIVRMQKEKRQLADSVITEKETMQKTISTKAMKELLQ